MSRLAYLLSFEHHKGNEICGLLFFGAFAYVIIFLSSRHNGSRHSVVLSEGLRPRVCVRLEWHGRQTLTYRRLHDGGGWSASGVLRSARAAFIVEVTCLRDTLGGRYAGPDVPRSSLPSLHRVRHAGAIAKARTEQAHHFLPLDHILTEIARHHMNNIIKMTVYCHGRKGTIIIAIERLARYMLRQNDECATVPTTLWEREGKG